MSWTLPKYIGHPGYQYTPSGPNDNMLFEHKLDDTLMIGYITPLEPQMEANLNVYSGKNAWGDYVAYLGSNQISPGQQNGKLKVVINNITPITESYNNEYGPSELQDKLNNVVGNTMRELAFATGFNGKSNLDKMSQQGGMKGMVGKLMGGLSEGAEKLGSIISDDFGRDLGAAVANPTQKIDIPQMWKGNSYTCSFEISIRLYCFSPKDDKYFGDYILAPLGALEMFAAPKSEQGKFYTWPFLMNFVIPGLVSVPLGYCSSLTVVKGGDNNDLSYINRPGMVDIRMGINSVYGVRVNALGGGEMGRPTILNGLEAMNDLEATSAAVISNGSSSSSSNQSNSRTNELTSDEQDAMNNLIKVG